MRLLLLTHRFPSPPDRGDRIRAHHLLRFLARRAEVSLASVADEPVPPGAMADVEDLCERVAVAGRGRLATAAGDAASLARGLSATEGHFWRPALAATVRRWAQERPPDAVVCFCSGMFRYTRLPELRSLPTVVDLVDVDSQKWAECGATSGGPRSWVQRLESRRVAALERRVAREADEVVVISDEERAAFQRVTGRGDARVVGNGVDAESFAPLETAVTPASCVFVGVLNYQPNVDAAVWFAQRVWPELRLRFPSARLRLVGKSPAPAVRALALLPGVELHADVPDVRPLLAASVAAVAPLRVARGVQNKVLEAMAMGLPTVVSPAARCGIAARDGEEFLVADEPAAWVEALARLFADAALTRAIGERARRFVCERHDWDARLAPLEDAVLAALRSRAAQGAPA